MIRTADLRAEQTRTERAMDAETKHSGQRDSQSPQLRSLRYKSGGDNHIVCRDWDGTTEGNVDVLVAMDPQLQKQLVGTGYTYSNFQNRTRDSDSRAEFINPAYVTNVILFAMPVSHKGVIVGTGDAAVDVVWLEISPSRHWSKAC